MSIIPIVCYCGKPIAHLWNKYMEELKILDVEEDEDIEKIGKKTNEAKVLDKLKIKKYCCRRMFLTNVDLCHKI